MTAESGQAISLNAKSRNHNRETAMSIYSNVILTISSQSKRGCHREGARGRERARKIDKNCKETHAHTHSHITHYMIGA